MNAVTVELWLWLGEELKGEFESPSEMRSVRKEVVEEGTSIRQLLISMAERYKAVATHIFDMKEMQLYPNVVLMYNNREVSPHLIYAQTLADGDKITVMPLYTGG